jgi:hypothetical protein
LTVLTDDHRAASGRDDIGGGLPPHSAAAADDHQFLPGEDRLPLVKPVRAHPKIPLGCVLAGKSTAACRNQPDRDALGRTPSDMLFLLFPPTTGSPGRESE